MNAAGNTPTNSGMATEATGEHLLWLLREKADDAVVQFGPDWRYRYLNAAALNMMGRRRDDLLGRVIWDEYPDMVGTITQTHALAAQREGREIAYEVFYAPLDKWLRIRIVPDGASGVTTFLMRDVTYERTRKAQRLLDAGLVGILYWSISGGVVDANDTFLQMLGYTRDDLLAGRIDWIAMTPPDLRERDSQPVADLLATGRHLPFEKEYLHKDGHRVPILVASAFNEGSRTDGIGFVVDISAQKQAQDESRKRGEEITTIFESMTDAFFALDSQWRITYINAEAERQMQQPRAALLGQVFWDKFAALGTPFETHYRQVMQERVEVSFEEFYAPLDLWVEVRAFPSRNGGLSVYFRNINERKRAEQTREAEREAVLTRQRQFMRDMVYSLTEGKFCLCLGEGDLPRPLPVVTETVGLTVPTLRHLRKRLNQVTADRGFEIERAQDIETAVGEAAMNAATHGGGGEGWVGADDETGRIQVWIRDGGGGISEEALPRVLEKGVSTAGTLGHGFWLMLRTGDRIYLHTSPHGTTIVLEMEKTPLVPAWLQAI